MLLVQQMSQLGLRACKVLLGLLVERDPRGLQALRVRQEPTELLDRKVLKAQQEPMDL